MNEGINVTTYMVLYLTINWGGIKRENDIRKI